MNVTIVQRFILLGLLAGTALSSVAHQAAAQIVVTDEPFKLTVEAYGNATGGFAFGADGTRAGGFADGAIRVFGQFVEGGFGVGLRIVLATSTDDAIGWGERSLVVSDRWGRVEVGWRQGLPDVLTGYAPNAFQFVSAEFGPASGASLDPNGGLQSRFIDRDLARRIDRLSILGVSTSYFADQSPKALYVSPKVDGWLLGVSFAPRIEGRAGAPHRGALFQGGLVKEAYLGADVLRLGGGFAFARGGTTEAGRVDDLFSLSGGVEYIVDAALAFGASFTFNARSGLTSVPGGGERAAVWGVAASVNYTDGPWQWGAYAQFARGESEPARGRDGRLIAGQVGGAYRFSQKVRAFGALWGFDFSDEGRRATGVVALGGFRIQL